MKRSWLSGLLFALVSASCTAQQPAQEDSCYGNPFGKGAVDAMRVTYEGKISPKVIVDSAAVTGPFRSPPLEIATIQRGASTEFIGGHINDGLASWTGLDLDSREIVSVTRTVWDKRAAMSRPFEFPAAGKYPPETVVRKWTSEDGNRKELEIVQRSPLRAEEIQAFVCLANIEWAQPRRPPRMRPTDTLSSRFTLISMGPKVTASPAVKDIDQDGVTGFILDSLLASRQSIWKN
ncbi:hypothetical protein [Polaromonas sp. YR568]|uniref:hypothetical protein n=1 Tax=Polaromonas sp. YR568 TaxID=1855301 RepID=UPI00398BDD40